MRLNDLFKFEDLLLEVLRTSSETFDELTMTREYDIDKPFNQQEWFSLDPKDKQNKRKTNIFYKICREHLTSFKHDIEVYVKENKFVDKKSVKSNLSITQSGLTNEKSLSAYVNFNLIDGTPLIIRISDHLDANKNHKGKIYHIKLGRYLSEGIKRNIDKWIEEKVGIRAFNSRNINKKPEVVYLNKRKNLEKIA